MERHKDGKIRIAGAQLVYSRKSVPPRLVVFFFLISGRNWSKSRPMGSGKLRMRQEEAIIMKLPGRGGTVHALPGQQREPRDKAV